jgi:aspartyl protease family protein
VPPPNDRNPRSPWQTPPPRTPPGRKPDPQRNKAGARFVVIGVILAVVLLALWLAGEGLLSDRDSQLGFTSHAAWLLLALPAAALIGRQRFGTVVRQASIWLAVVAVLVVGYSYRDELSAVGRRVMGEVAPLRGVEGSGGAMTFRAARDGHFHIEAEVEGKTVRFMVDTGASDVVLTAADARRLGFDLRALSFSRSYRTANGTVTGAPVTLREVRIGPIALRDVRASVNGGEMDQSILGMSFLGRLAAYGVEGGTLTLRQ